MNWLTSFFRRFLKQIAAIALIACLFLLARSPSLSAAEQKAIASRFEFTRLPLPELTGASIKEQRQVHSSLERHSAWISAVGAAVALNDLDGDGLPNDSCHVDPRTDQVVVAPVPGTGDRYQPFELKLSALPYDSETMAPMGCLPGDLNEDGQMDILVYYWGRTPVAFLRGKDLTPPAPLPFKGRGENDSPLLQGEGLEERSYIPQEIVPEQQRWFTNAATFADLDGDGHNDLILGNYFQDGSEILNANGTGIEEMQDSMTRAFNGGVNRIFRWQGATAGKQPTVEFQEAEGVLAQDIARGWTLAVGTADLDGDLLPEIYFANDFGPDRLLHNRSTPGHLQFALLEGQKSLTTPNSKVLGHDSFKGMGVDFADVNRDGWLDIYVSNIAAEYALEESHFLFTSTGKVEQMQRGIAPYVDKSEPLGVSRSGWGWETKFGDFDNDGELEALQATGFRKGEVNRWPELQELALSNDQLLKSPGSWFRFQNGEDLSGHQHNPFFVRGADGRYYDFAKELGLDDPFVTRGIATADVDGDGDLDFAVANQWEKSYFYRNDSLNPGEFLGLRLVREGDLTPPDPLPYKGRGEKDSLSSLSSNLEVKHNSSLLPGEGQGERLTPAIGATATVHLPDGRQLVAQVDGGNGHSGVRSPELHFGLGKIQGDVPLPVDLQWRDTDGQVRRESLLLSPGWHTVLLGKTAKLS